MKKLKRANFNEPRVSRFDPRKVHLAYANWPRLARQGFELEMPIPPGTFSGATIAAMGGSASGGDILAGWFASRGGPELYVWKGGPLTRTLRGTLVVACSVSGETPETLAMMEAAAGNGATVVSISKKGSLSRAAAELGIPHGLIPDGLAPRYMLPFVMFACLSILNRGLGLGCEKEASEAVRSMDEEGRRIGVRIGASWNPAKQLAAHLLGRTPAIYGTAVTRGVGTRFKNVMNENAKVHAYFDRFPDAFHNEIESWEDPSTSAIPVFLRHSEDGDDESKRMDLMYGMLESLRKGPIQVKGRGRSSLAQLATLAYRLDMASYYVAISSGVNPFPTPLMDRLRGPKLPYPH